MRHTVSAAAVLVWTIVLSPVTTLDAEDEFIRGIYGNPKPFWDRGARLDEYGVNAVFVHSGAINKELVRRARAENCRVFAEFATLNGKQWIEQHPEAHPIDDSGKPAPPATWFLGVCPTNKEFRQSRMTALRELLTEYEIDGVWMDYLHWHAQFEDPYPVFVKTCFNNSCIAAFEEWAGLRVQGSSAAEKAKWIFMTAASKWEDWRVSVLVDWAREIRGIVKSIRPQALVGNYQVAWKDEDLGGVRRRCLGLDFEALGRHVDVYSPMIYHGRSGKTPEYVRDYVLWFGERYASGVRRLWPIVQAHDEPRISPEEFETVLRYGMGGKSTGVMMFTAASVARDDGKMEAMKRVYTGK